MLKTSAAVLISTALMSGATLAQTATAPMPMPGASPAFVTDQPVGQYRASKLVGVDVYGTDNQKIGDINEVLIDGQGQAKAVVIGVGGFLGIGEKNVAVAFGSLEWMTARPVTAAATGTTVPMGGTAPMGGAAPAAPAPATDVTGSTTATGAAPVTTAPARSPAETAAYNGYPDHAMLRMSKADLQNAPAFKYYSETHSASERPAAATTMPATRP